MKGHHLTPALSPKGGEGVMLAGPGAHEAKTLSALFEAAQNGMRRMVALGLYAHEIKAQLKHGQFGQWLAEHAPHLSREIDGRALPNATLGRYMQLASGVLECTGYKLGEYLETAKIAQCDLSHGGEILLVEDSEVPAAAREMRDEICELIDGRTQRQLFAEFKTADDDEEGGVAKAGGAKPIKFHCQKDGCGAPMKGIFGRGVACPKCGTKQKAKPDPKSPEQEMEELKAINQDRYEILDAALLDFLKYFEAQADDKAALIFPAKLAKKLLDRGTELTAWARARLKKKGGSK